MFAISYNDSVSKIAFEGSLEI